MSDDDYTDDVFRTRAVSPEVAEERGYCQFGGPHGLAPLFEADVRFRHPDEGGATFIAPWDNRPHSFYNWSRYKVRGKTGWIMPKHALPGSEFEAPLAQLRPDVPIPLPEDDPQPHDHADMGLMERLLHEDGSAHVYPSGRHVRVDEDGYPLSEKDAKRGLGRELPLDGPHVHREASKYVLPPGPHGKRWDTHPFCTPDRFLAAERVFLHLEGCLKLDALVSAGEVGADVPSVTMWNRRLSDLSTVDFPQRRATTDFWDSFAEAERVAALQTDDLRRFLEACVRSPVVIVCDSDWRHNPAVAMEAFCLRDAVRDSGLPCVVAAPPEGRYLRTDRLGRRIHVKRGSDDFQFRGGKVDNLRVVEPLPLSTPGRLDFERWYRRTHTHGGLSGRRRPAETLDLEVRLLDWYATHATAEGFARLAPRRIAERLGVGSDAVKAATVRLAKAGALIVEGDYDDPAERPKRTKTEWKEWEAARPTEPWKHSHADMEPANLRAHLESEKWRDDHAALGDPDQEHVHARSAREPAIPTAVIRLRDDLRPELWEPTVGRWLRSLR